MSPAQFPGAGRPGVRFAPYVVAVLAFFAAISLGNWQVRRAQAKLALAAQWDAAAQAAPRSLDAAALARGDVVPPARVRVHGRFRYPFTVWLDNRALGGRAGFRVVTPLEIGNGNAGRGIAILVDRGWAPRDAIDRTRLPPIAEPSGEIDIEGLALSELPRRFALGEAPSGPLPAIWQNLDLAAFRRASGLLIADFVIEETGEQNGVHAVGQPASGLDRASTRPDYGADMHRGYAFQWYALAAVIAALTMWFSIRPRLRARRPA
jgi:cytochrome oxidase assembly protein ShyY1